ncbi:ABC transporter permease [Streptomyces zagrosensis]|uniref:Peptide/nickel transport system permease protein n=1 Tax=Streptomyces zagrosensis TaxID=1042984 RepID=A0A7W9V0Y6_9ACTN|nr:ABC transporter permease [Streptomyces zagrosensis]MBB5937711.1 peptide/nickel transport system permease protein [Streptomyces zagrosensis]
MSPDTLGAAAAGKRWNGPAVRRVAAWLLRQLAWRGGLCLAAAFTAYALASLSFDPLAELRGQQPRPPQAVIDAQARRLGLDTPLPRRFVEWLAGLPRGDFGETVGGRPVADELWRRCGTSLRLFLAGSLLAIVLGVSAGLWNALRSGRASDQFFLVGSLVLLSVPVFVLGTVLKMVWLPVNEAFGTQLLYFSGETTPGSDHTGWAAAGDRLRHLALPTLAIALPQAAFYSRYQRAAMLDVLGSDFLRAARAKGLRRGQAVLRHGVRLALMPMVALFAFTFGLHLTGGVFTERIFGWSGMGDWLLHGIQAQDATIVASVTLFIAVLVVLAGLLADAVQVLLDPRVRGVERR